MAEPSTTGEAIQVVRRALYDIARGRGANPSGATRQEVISYCIQRKLPVPVADDFERAVKRLREAAAVDLSSPMPWQGNALELRYRLTPKGDLEEETRRRPWIARVGDELRRPQTIVDVLKLFVGFLLGLALGLLLGPIRP